MQKSLTAFVIRLLVAGMMLAGSALAQQAPATNSQPASSAQTPSTPSPSTQAGAPAKTQTGTATKKTASTAAAPVVLKTQRDKESYAMGMDLGTGLRRQGLTLDPALVARGMKDAVAGGKALLTETEAKAALQQLRNDVNQNMVAANHKEAEAFLAANKTKEGVVTLPSGLQYKILTQGNGPKPAASDTVTVSYRGAFVNGTEFDNSYKRGQPASFPVSGVIKGWTEALQLMPVGSKWQLFIPADLAYGDSGRPGIPPGSTLVFEVELLSIGEQKK
ncbi:Peptidyl-prolyl cis-trans isomerase [Candidatus Sulfotelmatobacter kueseliae]|uniref:Peptidyl-prolyl cis-trans isomerase n=1 Tax=Candidatus Sulfotelmatobacter kueseliae TaxID=2042962 RepID=A0A2U3JW31_9BACT|nr:Peptidyl-prolyl cis-trans isomerase [Candidatus Sulfotelmatobacter kueseliae]